MSSLPVHPAAVPDFPEGLSEERDELSPLVTVFQVNIHLFLSNAYYLRSKMVVSTYVVSQMGSMKGTEP